MLEGIKKIRIDKGLLIGLIVLIIFGTVTFLSASLGKLATDEVEFYPFIKTQLLFILMVGPLAMFLGTSINYRYYRRLAMPLFILSILLALTVFIPSLSFEHQGGMRWINVFGFSFQPSEVLKFSSVVFMAYFCVKKIKYPKSFRAELLPFLIFSLIVGSILLIQKDFGTLFTILVPAFIVFLLSGVKFKHSLMIILMAILGFVILVSLRPYMRARIVTFFNPQQDLLGSAYQVNQALIAVGSGELTGRGLGQSIQKFSHYLPEQATDSIFAIYAEEMGFVGSLILLGIFLFIILRTIRISKETPELFGKFLIIGIISIFTIQVTLNILSTLHWAPVSGVPLPLISKGGSSLVLTMFMFGVILNISKYRVRI